MTDWRDWFDYNIEELIGIIADKTNVNEDDVGEVFYEMFRMHIFSENDLTDYFNENFEPFWGN